MLTRHPMPSISGRHGSSAPRCRWAAPAPWISRRARHTRLCPPCAAGDDTRTKMEEIKLELKLAVETEDYAKAASLKRELDALVPSPSQLERLQQDLQEAVQQERYQDAARLRDEVLALEESLKPPPPDRTEFEQLSTSSDTTTHGIRVQVTSEYVPSQSMPAMGQYFFKYTVKVSNRGQQTMQLINRHWVIKDSKGSAYEEVRGPGVVGQQPVLQPGSSFEYESACPLRADMGSMEGEYEVQVLDAQLGMPEGPLLKVAISRFALKQEQPGTSSFGGQ